MFPTIVTADSMARAAQREIESQAPTVLSTVSEEPRARSFRSSTPEGLLSELGRGRRAQVPSAIRHRESSSSLAADAPLASSRREESHRPGTSDRSEGRSSRLASVPRTSGDLDALMQRSITARHSAPMTQRIARPGLEWRYSMDVHEGPVGRLEDLSPRRGELREQTAEARSDLIEVRNLLQQMHSAEGSPEDRHALCVQALDTYRHALSLRRSVVSGAQELTPEDQRRATQFAEHSGWRSIGRQVLRAAQEEGLALQLD